jgi:hypothetical protein
VLEKDEQMALLVQRVSGEPYCDLFFPHMAGVGFSFNPYVWNEEIKQDSGMIRIVFGLGTRAVDRSDDDYTRVVALNAPDKRPESTFDEVKRYSQKRIDVLDLTSNEFTSKYFTDVMKKCDLLPIELFATKDKELAKKYKNDITVLPWVLTFEKVIKETNFINDMQELFEILKLQYEKNVDVEFAVNFFPDKTYKINLLQCRPFQIKENTGVFNGVSDLNKDDIIMETHSGVVGKSREIEVHKIIYVNPEQYSRLPMNERYAVARIIGKITHKTKKSENNNILLIGPGRWGTSMPSLGVPVKFNEINNVSVICEIDILHDHLVPDLSLGTHFFNEMVEMDILYLAYFNANKENCFNFNLINGLLNHLSEYTAESRSFDKVVKVVHCCDIAEKRKIYLNADALKQNTYLFKK